MKKKISAVFLITISSLFLTLKKNRLTLSPLLKAMSQSRVCSICPNDC